MERPLSPSPNRSRNLKKTFDLFVSFFMKNPLPLTPPPGQEPHLPEASLLFIFFCNTVSVSTIGSFYLFSSAGMGKMQVRIPPFWKNAHSCPTDKAQAPQNRYSIASPPCMRSTRKNTNSRGKDIYVLSAAAFLTYRSGFTAGGSILPRLSGSFRQLTPSQIVRRLPADLILPRLSGTSGREDHTAHTGSPSSFPLQYCFMQLQRFWSRRHSPRYRRHFRSQYRRYGPALPL